MVFGTYRDLLVAVASAAGALTSRSAAPLAAADRGAAPHDLPGAGEHRPADPAADG